MRCARLKPYLLFTLAALLALPTVGRTQRLSNPPTGAVAESGGASLTPSEVIPASTLQTIRDSTVNVDASWQKEALGGGVAGVVFGALVASRFCWMSEASDPRCARAALKGAFLFGVTGATVGAISGWLRAKPEPSCSASCSDDSSRAD